MSNELMIPGLQLPAELQSQLAGLQQHFSQAVVQEFPPRVSLKFQGISVVQGDTVLLQRPDGILNAVIVDVASHGMNTYFAQAYDPSATGDVKPHCWSSDGVRPDLAVPAGQKQSELCKGCPMKQDNSSKSGRGKACSFKKRIIIVPEEIDPQTGEVYFNFQRPVIFDVNASSVIGNQKLESGYSLEDYLRLLMKQKNPIPPILLVTKFTRDLSSTVPFVVTFNVIPVQTAQGTGLKFLTPQQISEVTAEFHKGTYSELTNANANDSQEVEETPQVGHAPAVQAQLAQAQAVAQPQVQPQVQQVVQQAQPQVLQAQPQVQPQAQPQVQPQAQPQVQPQAQPQAQAQPQVQPQVLQAQPQAQPQEQPQVLQAQPQGGLVAQADLSGFDL